MKYKVLDTNIPLLDHNHIIGLGGPNTVIVLPETVLDELDAKKSGSNELAYQSRSTARLLKSCTKVNRFELGDNIVVAVKQLNDVVIWVVALKEYPTYNHLDPNVVNDRKIIEVAVQLETYFKENGEDAIVEFTTNDYMCEERAESLGLTASDFKVVDKVDYEFTKTLEVSEEVFKNLHNKNIRDIDPEHLIEHYNYKFTTPDSTHMKIASINNETINILGKDTEAELRAQSVNPKNADQLLLSRAIQDPTMDMIVCEALAGSGLYNISLAA